MGRAHSVNVCLYVSVDCLRTPQALCANAYTQWNSIMPTSCSRSPLTAVEKRNCVYIFSAVCVADRTHIVYCAMCVFVCGVYPNGVRI